MGRPDHAGHPPGRTVPLSRAHSRFSSATTADVRSATAAIQVCAVGSTQSCGLAEEEDKAEVLARIVLDAYPSYCEVRAVADGVLDRR